MEVSTYNALHAQCAARDAVLAKVLQAQQLLREAAAEASCRGLGSIEDMLYRSPILNASQESLEGHIDAKAWEAIIISTGLHACMHTKARQEWDDAILMRQVPPLTRENIEMQLSAVHDNRAKFLGDGVVAVFQSLSYDYKSNEPVKFGRKVILENFHYMQHGSPNLSINRCSMVDDLYRLLCVSDGKPEATYKKMVVAGKEGKEEDVPNITYTTLNMDKGYRSTGATTIETPYYTLRVFKKGTAHIVFKRLDLVEMLNRAIGKRFPNALPAPV